MAASRVISSLAVAWSLALNPLVNELRPLVEWLFPISSIIKTSLSQIMSRSPSLGSSIGVFALLPAICEEFAFRGFILSGLEHQHRTRSAILLSALMFGFLHVLLSLFQQLFNATLLGIVLGLLAVRSRSICPGILFHFLNNAIAVTRAAGLAGSWAAGVAPLALSQPGGRALSWALDRDQPAGLHTLLLYLWSWTSDHRSQIASAGEARSSLRWRFRLSSRLPVSSVYAD